MKPTEADIQAELDRHGLGWVVTGAAFLGKAYTAGWADIGHPSDTMVIIAYGSGEKFQFKRKPEDIEIEYDDFLTGNYDLSAISHHYEPEEWQRIITMCERIVRLITGEQVEQSLEEKVREIASKAKLDISYIHDDEVSLCNTVHQYWIKADRVTYNTPQGSHIEKTITGYYDGFGNYRHEFKSIAALLTAQPETEQTLEEAGPKPTYEELEAQLNKLKADYQELDDEFEETHKRHCQARKAMERYQAEFLDMRRDRDRLATNYQRECERSAGFQDLLKKAERENASLLDKFGPIDQAEQQVAEVETRFQKLAKKCEKVADLLIQLNEEIL